jgi:hypothetical protein
MQQHTAASVTNDSQPTTANQSATPTPATSATDKKWQIDRASGVPVPVIRANMVSLRLSRKGRLKVAFFEQG